MFMKWTNCQTVFQNDYIMFIPTGSVWEFHLPTFGMGSVFNFSHSVSEVTVSRFGFNLRCLND